MASKLPTGTVDIPNFKDFIYRNDSPVVQTDVLVKLRGSEKLLYKSIFEGIPLIFKFQFPISEHHAILFMSNCMML